MHLVVLTRETMKDKKDHKYRKCEDYKDKGMKTCYITKEENIESSNEDKIK